MRYKEEIMQALNLKKLTHKTLFKKAVELNDEYFSMPDDELNIVNYKILQQQIYKYYSEIYDIKLDNISFYGKNIKNVLLLLLTVLYLKNNYKFSLEIEDYIIKYFFKLRTNEIDTIKKLKKQITELKNTINRLKIVYKNDKFVKNKQLIDKNIYLEMEGEIKELKEQLKVENNIILNAWANLQKK